MIAEPIKNNISRSGNFEERAFGVEINASLFSILTDLYVSKIGAVVRETTCNSRDAHLLNGNVDRSILVTAPTVFDPNFIVRDFGPGLSKDDVFNIYACYNNSQKRNSQSAIGYFGIGAKAPFTYAPSFQVISRFEGRKYTYNAYRSEENQPTMALLMEEECWEESGMEVIVGVQQKDITEFSRQIKYVTKFWDLKPTVVGDSEFQFEEVKWDLNKENSWGFLSGQRGVSKVVMGGVQYDLDPKNITDLKSIHRDILNRGVYLFAELGEINVPPPRESVEYTEKTIKFVKSRLTEIENDIVKIVNEKVSKVKTEYEARKLYFDIFTNYGELNVIKTISPNLAKFNFNNKEITTTEIELDPNFIVYFPDKYKDRQNKTRMRVEEYMGKFDFISREYHAKSYNFPVIFYDDKGKRSGKFRNLTRYYEEIKGFGAKLIFLSVPSYSHLQNYCNKTGIDINIFKNVDDHIQPPKSARMSIKHPKPDQFYNAWVYDPNDCVEDKDEIEVRCNSQHKIEYTSVDFNKDSGYYLMREGKDIYDNYAFEAVYRYLLENDDEFKDSPVIHIFTGRYQKKLNSNWNHVTSRVKKMIQDEWDKAEIEKIYTGHMKISLGFFDILKQKLDSGVIKSDKLSEFYNSVTTIQNTNLKFYSLGRQIGCVEPDLTEKMAPKLKELTDFWQKVVDSLPILGLIESYNQRHSAVNEYIQNQLNTL